MGLKNLMYLLILIFALISLRVSAQVDILNCSTSLDSLTQLKITQFADQMPEPEGGLQQILIKANKIKIESKPKDYSETRIKVAFVVNTKGEIIGERIIQNISGTNAAEQFLQIIKSTNWSIGKCEGKPIPVMIQYPLLIHLK